MFYGVLIIVIVIVLSLFFILFKKTPEIIELEEEIQKAIEKENKIKPKKKEVKSEIIEKEAKKEEYELPEAIKELDKGIMYVKSKIKEGINQATNEYGMSYEDIEEMVKSELYSQIEEAKEKIYKAIEEKDYETIDKQTHSLKGAALNLKINVLGLAFKEIDDAARQKEDINKIKVYIDKLYNTFEKLI